METKVKSILLVILALLFSGGLYAQFPANTTIVPPGTAATIGSSFTCTDAVGTDSYACNLSPTPASLASLAGVLVQVKAGTANTGAATFAPNGFVAKTIKKQHDQDLATGDIELNQIVSLVYNSTSDTWEMQSQVGQLSVTAPLYFTTTACTDGTATPADCAAAPAGSVIISAAASAVVVNTTAVTSSSQIFIQEDSSLGTRLSVTCNTGIVRSYAVTARTTGVSFTITSSAAPVSNPACLSYYIVN